LAHAFENGYVASQLPERITVLVPFENVALISLFPNVPQIDAISQHIFIPFLCNSVFKD
jgi:hypothetical protein